MHSSISNDAGIGEGQESSERGSERWVRPIAKWQHLGPVIAHIVAIATAGVGVWLPLLVALILWRVHNDDSPFLDDHGRESTNCYLSLGMWTIAAWILAVPTIGLSLLALLALAIVSLVAGFRGAAAAGRGEHFRYPMTIRLLRGR